MVDLVTLNTNLPGYADFAKGYAMSNELAKGDLEYQMLQDQYESQKGLRKLLSAGGQISPEDVMRYDPKLAQEMLKNQFATSKDLLEMQKTKGEIEEKQYKLNAEQQKELAHAHGAVVDAYDKFISQGYDPDSAAKAIVPLAGNLTAQLADRGIQTAKSFDEKHVTPDALEKLRVNARAYGYPLATDKLNLQAQQNMIPPQLTPQQAYGGVEMGPYGARQIPALPRAGQGQVAPQNFGPAVKATVDDLPVLQQAYDAEQDPNRKFQIGKMINDIKQSGAGTGAPSFVTPEQELDLKIKEEKAKKAASLEAEQEATAEQQFGTLKALDTRNVDELIDKSFKNKPEQLMKGEYGLSGMAGIATEANTATEELTVIEAQMRDMAKAIVGAGPISEGEQKIISKALGGIATAKDAESRKSAYHSFVDLAKEKLKKYPHLAQQMNAIEGNAPTAKPTAEPKSLKIGDVKSGYEYLGGDPSKQSNWAKVR